MFSIAKSIFNETSYFSYILTYKFSQDHLELLFARIRQRFESNNNPSTHQFKGAIKQKQMKMQLSVKLTQTAIHLMMTLLDLFLNLNEVKNMLILV